MSGACASRRASSRGTRRRSTSPMSSDADIPREVRAAGAEWWSLRAWMEHGATPYGAERLRDAIFGHQPFEVKQHIANFIMEELRHHEASFRIARAIGAGAAEYEPTPRADYFRSIIPRFHDERDERAMSFFGGLAVNTLFEQLSGELLQARYENARFESIKEACRLILRDEARHIQFGRIIMRRFFGELPETEKTLLGGKFSKKLRGSLLNGVYAVVNLPDDERRALVTQPGARRGVGVGRDAPRRRDRDHPPGPGQDPRGRRAVRRTDPAHPGDRRRCADGRRMRRRRPPRSRLLACLGAAAPLRKAIRPSRSG